MRYALSLISLLAASATLALAAPPSVERGVERDCVAANLHARPAACASLDLDGDRQADFAFSWNAAGPAHGSAAISIHLSRASASYQLLLPRGLSASGFALRDVNGDGSIDIALLGGVNQTVGVFLNDGIGNFEFDRQERYLTAPDRDVSEIGLPADPGLSDLAESSCGSSSAVLSPDGVSSELALASPGLTAPAGTPVSPTRGPARSRAP